MEFLPFLLLLFSFTLVSILIVKSIYSGPGKSPKLPPGPFQFPIIGNILDLGTQPHRSLAKLSQKYGPIMSLRLGTVKTIVISSPEAAKNVLQKHDSVFSGRFVRTAAESLNYGRYSVAWLPVGNQWRKLRKICKEQMFSVHSLDCSQGLRKENLEKLHNYVRESSEKGRAVDIGQAAFTTTLNLISSTLFSLEFAQFNSDSSQEMKDVVWGVMKCLGTPNLADFFPVLKSVDPQGISRETEVYFQKLFDIFDGIIDEKLKSRGDNKSHDLLESLIEINQRDEAELSRNEIKALLLDLFVAGIDTTSGTMEWAMTELLRHPDKLSLLRDEINDLVGKEGQIQESDISRLPYLQAVVKETFRLHSPAPLLIPHKAEADVEINGCMVPKNVQILINVWAIGRDSSIWPNVDSFTPERFLDQDCDQIDYKGKDFELIPFGAGRRMCPGLPLAYRMVHLMLATFVHQFSWRVEEGRDAIDMTEKFGMSLQKAIPIKAIPMKL